MPNITPYAKHIVDIHELPSELVALNSWVAWRLEQKPGKAKPDKIPVSPITGRRTDWTNPANHGDFETARDYAEAHKMHGLGIVLTPGCGLAGGDLDGCVDPDTGEPNEAASAILSEVDTYAELSPSLAGIRFIARGSFGGHTGNNREAGVELYEAGRFLTITGNHLEETPFAIEERDLTELGRRYFDQKTTTTTGGEKAVPWQPVDITALAISDFTRHVIETGDVASYLGDRSGALFGVALDLLRAGLSDEDCARVLTDPNHGISAKALGERGGDLASALDWTLKYTVTKARLEIKDEPPPVGMRLGEGAATLTDEDVDHLLSWATRTHFTLPSAKDAGIFEGPINTRTKKPAEQHRVTVIPDRMFSAPWRQILWDHGQAGFMDAVDQYLPRRAELVERENAKRRDKGHQPQNDIPPEQLREHAERWLASILALSVTEEEAQALLARLWPAPQPLTTRMAPEPYPLDALPSAIQAAVREVAGFVQAPVAMVASSALAALSLAGQAHTDVKRLEKLTGPIGLFLLTIADSGERKSTCDGFFTKTIIEYEEAQAEAAEPVLKDYRAAISSWESKCGGVKEKIRTLAKEKKATADMEAALRELEHAKPDPPRVPRLIYADATPEALAYELAKRWPSGGVLSSEAGIVFGSHGMGKDSVMRNLAMLNQLWDGKSLPIDRRTSESFTVRGARLTMALQIQEPTLREFFIRSGTLARGTGFLARFLIAWPESTQGTRLLDPQAPDGPSTWRHLAGFHRRLAELLNQPVPMDERGALTPPLLTMDPDAKPAWVEFYNAIESELKSGGELYDVKDVASKTADNAVRLAALFQLFEGSGGAIGAEVFEGASRITAWHLHESRRFFGEMALPAELVDAARLDSWIVAHCREGRTQSVGKNHVRQHGPIRDGSRLDAAIRELGEMDRLRLVKEGKRLIIQVNPAL